MPLVLMTDDRAADWAGAARRLPRDSVVVVRARDAKRRRALAEELSGLATLLIADDPALAEEKQHRILTAAALVEGWRGIAALKYGCDLNAYFGGLARLPLLPLDGEERKQVEAALAGLKN